jgi:hypothetical protein
VEATVVISRFEHTSFQIQSRSGNLWFSVMFYACQFCMVSIYSVIFIILFFYGLFNEIVRRPYNIVLNIFSVTVIVYSILYFYMQNISFSLAVFKLNIIIIM